MDSILELAREKGYNKSWKNFKVWFFYNAGVASGLVVLPDFKSGGGLTRSTVGSIPIYSRHF